MKEPEKLRPKMMSWTRTAKVTQRELDNRVKYYRTYSQRLAQAEHIAGKKPTGSYQP